MDLCAGCQTKLDSDEIGLTKKLINRGCTDFYCVNCLSKRLNLSVERLRELAERYRASGCTLFT